MYLNFPGRRSNRRVPVAAHEGSRRASLERHAAEAGRANGLSGADRVAERGIVQVVRPYPAPQFAMTTPGGRPGKSRDEAIARVARLVADGYTVAVTADVRKAFDTIPHDKLVDVIRNRLGVNRLTALIEMMVRGRGSVGIAQGGALSTLLLNVYLDRMFDQPWQARRPNLTLIRWVDDSLVLTSNRESGKETLNDLTDFLNTAGLGLDQTPPPAITDPHSGNEVEWLGFRLDAGPNELEARIAERAWDHLKGDLWEARQPVGGIPAGLGFLRRRDSVGVDPEADLLAAILDVPGVE